MMTADWHKWLMYINFHEKICNFYSSRSRWNDLYIYRIKLQ